MANIRIKDLPVEGSPNAGDRVPIDLGTTRQATVESFVMAGRPTASKYEAEVGTDPKKAMTPLTVKQAIDAQVASKFVPNTRKVNTNNGLTGGGELTGDVTLGLNSASLSSLAKANTAVQTVNNTAPSSSGNVNVSGQEIRLKNNIQEASDDSYTDDVRFLQTAGYYTAGDGGGALYKRAASEPTHAGKMQSADGAWWEISVTTINILQLGADPTGTRDSTIAIREAIKMGIRVEIPKGDFIWDAAVDDIGMVLTTHGQEIFGHGAGMTAGGYAAWGMNYKPHSRIIMTGSGRKIERTRRNHRASSSDPSDDPMSAAITRAADGTMLRDFCLWLDCDYSDMRYENRGADWDIGVHNMCRIGSREENLQVVGYFRKYGRLQENTSLDKSLPIPGYDIPDREFRGTDNSTYVNSYQRGARIGVAILGAKKRIIGMDGNNPVFDPMYYDSAVGALVPDNRGSFGASDTSFIDPKLFGPDHHSGRRLAQPRPDLNHLLEPEDMPACLYIDGWANNSTETRNQVIQGVTLSGRGRLETIEAFHVRLDRVNRFQAVGHVDYSGYVDPDQPTVNYGSITGTDNTRNVVLGDGWMSNPREAYFGQYVRGWYNIAPESGNSQFRNINADSIRQRSDGSDPNSNFLFRKAGTGAFRFEKSDGTHQWSLFDSGTFAPGTALGGQIGSTGNPTSNVYTQTLRIWDGTGFLTWTCGNGSPEGAISARPGSIYMRVDGAAAETQYVKQSSNGNTGWVIK